MSAFFLYAEVGGDVVARGKKIDDKTRELIRAHYASCGNMNETAKHFGVSWSTVQRICQEKDGLEKLRDQKKKDWIEEAWRTIRLYMKHVQEPKVVSRTSARDSAILIGTLHDKILKAQELELKQRELDLKEKEIAQKNAPPENPNIEAYIEALKGRAKEVWKDE